MDRMRIIGCRPDADGRLRVLHTLIQMMVVSRLGCNGLLSFADPEAECLSHLQSGRSVVKTTQRWYRRLKEGQRQVADRWRKAPAL